MKHPVSLALGAIFLGAAVLGLTACKQDADTDKTYSVYAPDGAPALALVNAIEDKAEKFEYHVVDSSTIQTYVTGEEPAADFCILPLNAASKVLGTGTTYQMLGTVTNGNLFFLSSEDNEDLTQDNISTLVGKSVGVVQLPNVPGLTLQAVLNKYDIDYQIVENDGEKATDKVNPSTISTIRSSKTTARRQRTRSISSPSILQTSRPRGAVIIISAPNPRQARRSRARQALLSPSAWRAIFRRSTAGKKAIRRRCSSRKSPSSKETKTRWKRCSPTWKRAALILKR